MKLRSSDSCFQRTRPESMNGPSVDRDLVLGMTGRAQPEHLRVLARVSAAVTESEMDPGAEPVSALWNLEANSLVSVLEKYEQTSV